MSYNLGRGKPGQDPVRVTQQRRFEARGRGPLNAMTAGVVAELDLHNLDIGSGLYIPLVPLKTTDYIRIHTRSLAHSRRRDETVARGVFPLAVLVQSPGLARVLRFNGHVPKGNVRGGVDITHQHFTHNQRIAHTSTAVFSTSVVVLVVDSNEVRRKNKRSQLGRVGGACYAEMRVPAVCHFGTQVLSASLVCTADVSGFGWFFLRMRLGHCHRRTQPGRSLELHGCEHDNPGMPRSPRSRTWTMWLHKPRGERGCSSSNAASWKRPAARPRSAPARARPGGEPSADCQTVLGSASRRRKGSGLSHCSIGCGRRRRRPSGAAGPGGSKRRRGTSSRSRNCRHGGAHKATIGLPSARAPSANGMWGASLMSWSQRQRWWWKTSHQLLQRSQALNGIEARGGLRGGATCASYGCRASALCLWRLLPSSPSVRTAVRLAKVRRPRQALHSVRSLGRCSGRQAGRWVRRVTRSVRPAPRYCSGQPSCGSSHRGKCSGGGSQATRRLWRRRFGDQDVVCLLTR